MGGRETRVHARDPLAAMTAEVVLDRIDTKNAHVSLEAVIEASRAWSLGDPATEDALLATREIFASDLADWPEIDYDQYSCTVVGRRAGWTLRADDLSIAQVRPHEEQHGEASSNEGEAAAVRPEETGVTEPELAEAPPPAPALEPNSPGILGNDLVTQLERLASLLERGLLAADEFAAAKAKLLA